MAASRVFKKIAQFAAKDAFPIARSGAGAAREAMGEITTAVLGRDFEDRLKRVPLPISENGVDPFGLDPEWAKYAMAVAAFFHRFYFRTEVFGIDRVPQGRVLLIANH